MANLTERVFTPTEVNRLKEDIENVGRKSKLSYPVTICNIDGKTGKPRVSALELKPVSTKEFNHVLCPGTKKEFVFKGLLTTYEYFDPQSGETRRITFPDMDKLDTVDLLNFTADMIQFCEALRRLNTMGIMIDSRVVETKLPSTGVMLADKLLGEPGISSTVEMLLKESYVRYGSTAMNWNNYMKLHEDTRALVELKDKYWSSLNNQYEIACRKIAKKLAKSTGVSENVSLGSNGIIPTMVQDAHVAVSEVSDMTKYGQNGNKNPFEGLYESGSTIK